MKIIVTTGVILLTGFLSLNVYNRFIGPFPTPSFLSSTSTVDGSPSSSQIAVSPPTKVRYKIELVAQNLQVPWSIVFTTPTRALITERAGQIRILENNVLQPIPLHTIEQVSSQSEEGLMGMVTHPKYEQNRYIYVCYAYAANQELKDRVVRFKDEGSFLTEETVIIDQIPAASFHAGCRLRFGPDQKLYITTGDATNRDIAQDKNSLGGKILRLNDDGSIPIDNPFPNSQIYSLGHRNPQGIDWHPESGVLWETEHGPSGNDGAGGGDEVNKIEAGGNYGWPTVSHERSAAPFISPSIVYTPAVAPASGMFYSGTLFPQWKNNFFFGMLRGSGIMRITISSDGKRIESHGKIEGVDFGRIREITQAPDGSLYFSTSNRDGRGRVRIGDDKIYRIVPE